MPHIDSTHAHHASRTVLMVDDEPALLETWSILLELEGFAVLTASNAGGAFQAATEYRPSLVITDFRMPGVDGLELCRWLKNEELTKNIPIIMWTGSPMDAHDDLFERVAVKPVALELLMALICELLR